MKESEVNLCFFILLFFEVDSVGNKRFNRLIALGTTKAFLALSPGPYRKHMAKPFNLVLG